MIPLPEGQQRSCHSPPLAGDATGGRRNRSIWVVEDLHVGEHEERQIQSIKKSGLKCKWSPMGKIIASIAINGQEIPIYVALPQDPRDLSR